MSYLLNNYNILSYKSEVGETVSTQLINNSAQESVNGTRISFTPLIKTEFIMYECYLQANYQDYNSELSIELYENDGTGWTNLGDIFCVKEKSAGNMQFGDATHLRYLIPGYSGTKTYELRARATSTSTETNLPHNNIIPTVIMYSWIE
jgi:hypothetical protein